MYLAAARVHQILKPWWLAEEGTHTVSDLLARRRPERNTLYAVLVEDSALEALQLMLDFHVKSVAVIGERRPFEGIFTDTDFLRQVALGERNAREVAVGEVMTPLERTAYVYPGNSMESCLEIMAAMGCHHLPVVSEDEDALLAVIAMEEVLGLTREAREAIAESSWLGRVTGWEDKAVNRHERA